MKRLVREREGGKRDPKWPNCSSGPELRAIQSLSKRFYGVPTIESGHSMSWRLDIY